MGLESASFIPQLVASNPVGATDPKSQGDDHLRLLKQVLQNQFPNIGTTAVTATAAQLNAAATLSGVVTGFAAPTKKIGNAANADGVASTAMRSDATIQLDVTLPYSWGAQHTFSAPVILSGNSAQLIFRESDALTNQGQWGLVADGAVLKLAAFPDSFGYTREIISASRTGAAITDVSFGNASDAPTYTFIGNKAARFNGGVIATGGSASFDPSISQVKMAASVGGLAVLSFVNVGNPADNKIYDVLLQDSNLDFRLINDAQSATQTWMLVQRSGLTATVNFPTTLTYQGNEVGYRDLPDNVVSTNYTLANTDRGKSIIYAAAGGHTFTIPSSLNNGAIITVFNGGGGNLTIAPSGVSLYWFNGSGTLSTGNRTLATGGVASICRNSVDVRIWGVGLS